MKWMSWRFFFRAMAEDIPLEDIFDELIDFDQRFVMIVRRHMAVLGWWCIINVATGLIGLGLVTGRWGYFFMMNISWSVINFAIVLWIFNHSYYKRFAEGDFVQRIEVQRHMEKIMLLNIGLDLAYIFAGLALLAYGQHPDRLHPDLWQGFGWSVVVQGVFLIIQDNAIHYLHVLNFRKARPFINGLMKDQLVYKIKKKALG